MNVIRSCCGAYLYHEANRELLKNSECRCDVKQFEFYEDDSGDNGALDPGCYSKSRFRSQKNLPRF